MIYLVILAGAFIAGAVFGVLVLLRLAGSREGRWLGEQPPTRAAAAARRLTGLRVQVPGQSAGHGACR